MAINPVKDFKVACIPNLLTCEVSLDEVLGLFSVEAQQHIHLGDVAGVQADGVARLSLDVCKQKQHKITSAGVGQRGRCLREVSGLL